MKQPRTKKTIAIDFDGVIHDYKLGWQDGRIYGMPNPGALRFIATLLARDYSVFIHSARSPWKIKRWLEVMPMFDERVSAMHAVPLQVVPFWYRFWDRRGILGITRRKMAAAIYIDDRAYKFGASDMEPDTEFSKLLEQFD